MAGMTKRPAAFDDSSAEPGVWRYAKVRRARVVIDAQDYFALMQQAMLKARERILLIGWDFDTRIHLGDGRRWYRRLFDKSYPARLGSFILWLTRHNRQLEVRILKWSFGWISFARRGIMLMDLARWWRHRRISFKFDSVHPPGCSHHQKIAIIDGDFAVCGGIDMTGGRWDTRGHQEEDARRKLPGGKSYGPWHDMTMMLEGEGAAALEELGRDRWGRAGGKPLRPPTPTAGSVWPDGLEADFENVEIGIARTRARTDEEAGVDEIAQLFVHQIASAQHFIYAESQYFASRIIAEAIGRRLAEDNPPEIIIVHPDGADGWVEGKVMDPARARLVAALRKVDRHGRFHLYVPYTGETPIYVHAKLLIVDDLILRIGSANFNNRSMGLDSECDVFIDCARPGNGHCTGRIRELRHSLLAEHCGLDEGEVGALIDRHRSMAGMISALGLGRQRNLRPLEPEDPGELEAELVDRAMFDPETPEELFEILPARRGLFRPHSLLGKAVEKLKRKRRT